jgi:hypothetical protein
MDLEGFFRELKYSEVPFTNNMGNLNNTDPRHIEEWMKLFCDWMEIEQPENKDPRDVPTVRYTGPIPDETFPFPDLNK